MKDKKNAAKYAKKYHILHRDKINTRRKMNRVILKRDIIKHYSDGSMKCVCCGEDEIKFLSIDHIDGCGMKQRLKFGTGVNFYLWLKMNGFPSGLRVLCYNCNCGRYLNNGICPHAEKNRGVNE